MISHMIYLTAAIVLTTTGQLLLKLGTQATHGKSLLVTLTHYYVLSGVISYFTAAAFYIYAIKKIPLSIAYPTISVSYIIIVFASYFIFKEPLTLNKVSGVFFILLGVYLMWR